MKNKVLRIILIIVVAISIIPFIIELGIILSSDYIMICQKEDKEYIQKYADTNSEYTIALVKCEGFLDPIHEAKVILNNYLPYPNVFGKQIVIERSDEIPGSACQYIKDNSNKIEVLCICLLPYIVMYMIIGYVLRKDNEIEKGNCK